MVDLITYWCSNIVGLLTGYGCIFVLLTGYGYIVALLTGYGYIVILLTAYWVWISSYILLTRCGYIVVLLTGYGYIVVLLTGYTCSIDLLTGYTCIVDLHVRGVGAAVHEKRITDVHGTHVATIAVLMQICQLETGTGKCCSFNFKSDDWYITNHLLYVT